LEPVSKFETDGPFRRPGDTSRLNQSPPSTPKRWCAAAVRTAEADFTELVFRFSPDQFSQFTATLGTRADTPPKPHRVLTLERESSQHARVTEGWTQAFLARETIDNVDAEPGRGGISTIKSQTP